MKQTFLLLLLLFAGHNALAQDSTIQYRSLRVILKLAPLSLLDPDMTVQGGVEVRVSPRNSVQVEAGYGWQGLSPFDTDLKDFLDAEVWRGRAEWRFYTGRYRTNLRRNIRIRSPFPLGNYWAIEGNYKQINVLKQINEYSEGDPSQPGYVLTGSRQVSITRYVVGTHVKVGRQISFYDPQKRLFTRTLLDMYVGVGLRAAMNTEFSSSFNPFCSCELSDMRPFGIRPRSFTETGTLLSLSLAAGLKIGFGL